VNFQHSVTASELTNRLQAFIDTYVLPHNAAWHQSVLEGVYPPNFMDDLKILAQEQGLWNLCLLVHDDVYGNTGLSNLDYAPLAESMGRIPWSAEVFNCNAPDSGNMALLQQFATPVQRKEWLNPLMAGRIRSAFAMSEPDVASSDPINLQTSVKQKGDRLEINGRKWFITGAAHPQCQFMLVVCRNESLQGEAGAENLHKQHSIVLIPLHQEGVEVVRNIPVVHKLSPEGHCEITFRNVSVPLENLMGQWGEGFALAQYRLGPSRIHHCMRTIGQCELALDLATSRAMERKTFGHYLADYANVKQWIAESRMEIDQARLLVLRVAWCMDQLEQDTAFIRAQISGIKVVAANLQSRVVERAIQIFGAMGLSPDTPLAEFWTWGRAMHLMDGPDEVHYRAVARYEFKKAELLRAKTADYFTTPQQMREPVRVR
jgi:acyl-CoA dehydrogenase